jgi:sugar phosphate isomerase/epimerase
MKIGVMNNPSEFVHDQIASIGKANYDFVDLTVEGPKALDIDVERILPILHQYDLGVVGHTDPCLPYAYPFDKIRKACLDELERCAEVFSALGATIMNIHPCYSRPPAMKQALVDLNIEALGPILKMSKSYGLQLVFENFRAPFDKVSTHERILKAVPGLKLHLDFGHANMGKHDGETFCRRLGPHIAHVHFSDNRSSGDHHMPLGVGSIDWRKAVSALKGIGYDGTITLEVFCDDPNVLFQYLEVSRRYLLKLWNTQ